MYKILFSLLLMSMLTCNVSSKSKENSTVTDAMWRSEVIVPMKEALERLAIVSPKFGADTESVWAANQVVMLSDSLDNIETLSFYDAMYDIYSKQMYIAYGLAYVPSMMSLYRDNEIAREGVNIVNRWRSLKENKPQEKQLEWLSQMSLISLYNYTAFYMAYDVMSEAEVFKANDHYSMVCDMQYYMDGIRTLCPTDTVGYQHCCVLEASAFFMTFFPLLRGTCDDVVFERNVNQHTMATAEWFDSEAITLKRAVLDSVAIGPMSEIEFYSFMKESTRRKVQLLDFLTMAIDSMENQKEE